MRFCCVGTMQTIVNWPAEGPYELSTLKRKRDGFSELDCIVSSIREFVCVQQRNGERDRTWIGTTDRLHCRNEHYMHSKSNVIVLKQTEIRILRRFPKILSQEMKIEMYTRFTKNFICRLLCVCTIRWMKAIERKSEHI